MLHIPTLLLANSLVMGLSGALLLFSWWRGREERTLLWMGSVLLLGVAGVVLTCLRGRGYDVVPILFGNVLVLLATGGQWMAVRLFCGRRVYWPGLLAAPAIWALLCLWPTFYYDGRLRILAYSILVVACLAVSMRELLRYRHRLPVSIAPALVLMGSHLVFFAVRPLVDPTTSLGSAVPSEFFGWVVIEGMLYAVGAGFVMLSMVKERAEVRQRRAALTDPLTGIGNRRAFTESTQRLLGECREQSVAMLICDLDHFKQVNDRFGHAAGDRALQQFADVLCDQLGGSAVFGRIGGEEFACLICGEAEQALQLAERIRVSFVERVRDYAPLSVSIGVADCRTAGRDLQTLMSMADAALYQAKRAGRDQVKLAERAEPVLEIAAAARRRFR